MVRNKIQPYPAPSGAPILPTYCQHTDPMTGSISNTLNTHSNDANSKQIILNLYNQNNNYYTGQPKG